jgi:outer membrane lipoprotein carrier protein
MRHIVVLVLFGLLSTLSFAEGDVAQLHLHLSGAQSLNAKFVQQVRDVEGELLQESKGTIALKRPNKIRWESTEPFHYLLVSDGKTVWRYDADLEQLNTEPFDSKLAQSPAMIISASIEQLAKQYDVSVKKQGNSREFLLTPKTESAFTQMALTFVWGKLTAMRLTDTLEQTTQIDFVNPKYNGKFDDALFRIKESELAKP